LRRNTCSFCGEDLFGGDSSKISEMPSELSCQETLFVQDSSDDSSDDLSDDSSDRWIPFGANGLGVPVVPGGLLDGIAIVIDEKLERACLMPEQDLLERHHPFYLRGRSIHRSSDLIQGQEFTVYWRLEYGEVSFKLIDFGPRSALADMFKWLVHTFHTSQHGELDRTEVRSHLYKIRPLIPLFRTICRAAVGPLMRTLNQTYMLDLAAMVNNPPFPEPPHCVDY
jgi:hypothetical protein